MAEQRNGGSFHEQIADLTALSRMLDYCALEAKRLAITSPALLAALSQAAECASCDLAAICRLKERADAPSPPC